LLNRGQASWAEQLEQYHFQLLYQIDSLNDTADTLSRCPTFTSWAGGTTSETNQIMLEKEQSLKVRAIELNLNDGIESIQISLKKVEQLLPEVNEWFKEIARLNDRYTVRCKQVSSGGNIDKRYSIKDKLLCWKNRMYVPEFLRQGIIASEPDWTISRHFGRDGTLELVTRIFD